MEQPCLGITLTSQSAEIQRRDWWLLAPHCVKAQAVLSC